MALLPVLLLNDGESLSLARVLPTGEVQRLQAPLGVPAGDPVAGRFFSTPHPVIDRHRQGLRVLPAGAVPALPPPPDEVAHLWATPLSGDRGFITVRQRVHVERGPYFTTPELVLFEQGTWRRQPLPDWLLADDVTYEDDWGWLVAGRRRGRPVLWRVDVGAEVDVPWRFPWWNLRISDGSFMSTRRSGARLVVEQDNGTLEHRVTTVYLRTADRFLRRYVGDDGARQVLDPDGHLPEVLLGSGRWLTRRGNRLQPAPRLPVAEEVRAALDTARSSLWQRVVVVNDAVSALVSLWPSGQNLLLQAELHQELRLAHSWDQPGERPVDLTVADTNGYDWAN